MTQNKNIWLKGKESLYIKFKDQAKVNSGAGSAEATATAKHVGAIAYSGDGLVV